MDILWLYLCRLGRYDQDYTQSPDKGNYARVSSLHIVGATTATGAAAAAATAAALAKKPPQAPSSKGHVNPNTPAANAPIPSSPMLSPSTPVTPALQPSAVPSTPIGAGKIEIGSHPIEVVLPNDTSFKSAEKAGEVAARLTPTRSPGGQAITAAGLPKPALSSFDASGAAAGAAPAAAGVRTAWKPPSSSPEIPALDRTDSGGEVLSPSRAQPRASLGFLTAKVLGSSGPGSQQWSGKALQAPPPLPPPPKDEPQTAAAKYAARQAALAKQQEEEEVYESGDEAFGTPKSEVSTAASDFSWISTRSEAGGSASAPGSARSYRTAGTGASSTRTSTSGEKMIYTP